MGNTELAGEYIRNGLVSLGKSIEKAAEILATAILQSTNTYPGGKKP